MSAAPAYDRAAPRRPGWVLLPAWYYYQLGVAVAEARWAETEWRFHAPGQAAARHQLAREAWRREGAALGRLWASLLGDAT